MELITTHINADFDALASCVAARRLYPNAIISLPGSQERVVRDFLSMWSDLIGIVPEKRVDLKEVTKLIIVETRVRHRIGRFEKVLNNLGLEIHIYDHHPRAKDDIHAVKDIYEKTGATVTTLLGEMRKLDIKPTPIEATIMALGIYEDTGNLTFRMTTKKDIEMVGYLLECGANLRVISSYTREELRPDEISVLRDLLDSCVVSVIKGVSVSIASCVREDYISEFSAITHRFIDVTNYDVVFSLAMISGKIQVVARSRLPAVNVGLICADFGGGGHPSAASAHVKENDLEKFRKKLISSISRHIKGVVTAADLMQRPSPRADMANAATVAPSTSIYEMRRICLEDKKNSFIVVDKKRRIGVVFKTALLESLHRDFAKLPHLLKVKLDAPQMLDVSRRMRKLLPYKIMNRLREAGLFAGKMGFGAFVVGGFVRDLLLGVKNFDLDIVVEGSAIDFAKSYADRIGGALVVHKKFGTATIVIKNTIAGKTISSKIDIASARTESYVRPAALPTVEFSSIKEDLYRRDFTINAMAIRINRDFFGQLLDFFQGQGDLKANLIRVLHDDSFVDDPTRIFRAVRFEQRLGFKIEEHTEQLIKHAIGLEMFERVEKQRLRDEIILILSEERPINAIARMDELHELRFIHTKIKLNRKMKKFLVSLEDTISWFRLSYFKKRSLDTWLIYFMALTRPLTSKDLRGLCDKYVFTKADEARMFSYKKNAKRIIKFLGAKKPLMPHEIYLALERISYEELILIMAYLIDNAAKKRISDFIAKYKDVRISCAGRDLMSLGLKPGPHFSRILRKTLFAKIDGKLRVKKDEMSFVRSLIK